MSASEKPPTSSIHFTFIVLAASVLQACSSDGSADDPAYEGGFTPPSTASGSCQGTAVIPRQMTDIVSCQIQGGNWDSTYKECNYKTGGNVATKCTDKTSSGKEQCLTLLGCSWTNADGTVEQNADLGGTCSGTVARCETIKERAACSRPAMCEWKALKGVCERVENLSQPTCGYFSTLGDPAQMSIHPTTKRSSCTRVRGCTFTAAGGTSVTAP